MSRPGDWNCRSCQHLNFQRRDMCQRCGEPKSGGGVGRGGSGFGYGGSDVRPGDWYCSVGNCGAHNFASRSSCFKCGAFKDDMSAFDFDIPRPSPRGISPFAFASPARAAASAWKSGRVAMNITLQAGWSALDAVLRETPTNKTSQAKILLHHQVLGMLSTEKNFKETS
ncbi:putative RNA-binding protein C17H9.04c-like [Cucumis melo var. makuwa]|uniref:RNA-binding protein C17H9.04c-like n=1 Tax=Cucumis melo var. makuwa TaxID=1194695 RepID=A0A5A7TRE1_CUCMM|nr:putative RNA-binding protein C17H9.04c-like [Cucumis melo var. makuwa]TYK29555.1 putative RNA-binding protein C17H9.04c-like [Cucumis melo var. makuwa]